MESKQHRWVLLRDYKIIIFLNLTVLMLFLVSCTDFVTVDLPKNQLSTEVVFEDAATAESAIKNIYVKMRDGGITGGHGGSPLNTYMGVYTDELIYEGNAGINSVYGLFQTHNILANNSTIEQWWKSTYNQIYEANAVIEGVGNSTSLSVENRDKFKGEALFIRAYLHLLLVEIHGDIPYITTTDYISNTKVARMDKALVYENIITDLNLAIGLLPDEDFSGQKVRAYDAVAEAILARAYLYTKQWPLAEATSTKVINKFGALGNDLSILFLNDAAETIWQFKPNKETDNPAEAVFVVLNTPPNFYILNNDFVNNGFESGDQRKVNWVGEISDGTNTWYFPFKYKEKGILDELDEYSIELRLPEQYLIRAEARAQLLNVSGAQEDINAIRGRAGLEATNASTLDALLTAILQERRIELFTEGHRWFDLKRMGKAAEVLSPIKLNWKDTNILLPIPESELLVNPNLLPQNEGYESIL